MTGSAIILKVMRIVKNILLYIVMLAFLFPFIMVVLNSIKTDGEFLSNPLSLPSRPAFTNFISAFAKMNFVRSFSNSLVITVISTGLIVLLASMTAYRIVRSGSKFNNVLFYSMLATMIIPFQSIMIPLVGIYFGKLSAPSSKWLLIYMYMGFGIAQAVFLYSGFIKSIPHELEEASMIDGCTKLQTFFQVVFPLLKPITMTVIIIDVLWIWNDFLLPTLILGTTMSEYTLPLSTFKFFGTYTAQYTLLMASLLMTMLPVIILYFLLQKYIVTGLTQGAVKG